MQQTNAVLVWTVVDWTQDRCSRDQIGKPRNPAEFADTVWTMADVVAGNCTREQVGTPKPDPDEVEQALANASAATLNTEQFKRDVLIAYQALGGPRYLMQKPQLLEKLLVKLAGEQRAPSGPQSVTVNLSWLSPDRLSYRTSGHVVDVAPAIAGDQLLTAELGPQEGA